MTPEQKSRQQIDRQLEQAGWNVQDYRQMNISAGPGIPVPVPPASEQAEIIALVDEKLSQMDAADSFIEHGLLRTNRLRQSILKQAFEGKLVPQDTKDEPASFLLSRISQKRKDVETATAPKTKREKAQL